MWPIQKLYLPFVVERLLMTSVSGVPLGGKKRLSFWRMTKMNNTYDRLAAGHTVVWSELDEQGRYEAWSFYARNTRAPFAYVPFCEHMDQKTSASQTLRRSL